MITVSFQVRALDRLYPLICISERKVAGRHKVGAVRCFWQALPVPRIDIDVQQLHGALILYPILNLTFGRLFLA